jgi:formate hydrogenlyase subunit 4
LNLLILSLNIILAIIIAPFVDGFRRKITARLQNRTGPPLNQSWYDILKLLKKETVLPEKAGLLIQFFPILSFTISLAMFVTISTFLPQAPMQDAGIVFIELAILSAFIFAVAGSISRNPYSVVGGSRETILAILIEPSIILIVLNLILLRNTLTLDVASGNINIEIPWVIGIASYLLCLLGEGGRVPFDIAEAESELSGGSLIEFSGPQLAMLKFSQYLKLLALLSIFRLYLPGIIPIEINQNPLSHIILYFLFIALGTIFVALAESLNARYRLSEVSKFYAYVFVLALFALIFTVWGTVMR